MSRMWDSASRRSALAVLCTWPRSSAILVVQATGLDCRSAALRAEGGVAGEVVRVGVKEFAMVNGGRVQVVPCYLCIQPHPQTLLTLR